ncbi:long-chain-fatty-acid--CoA ligase [Desulfoluna limicola]|uniref:Long-chain-fatty-acid--CoA ligase n=1 Tax=Desulfoluna limicola TaxID=2810562 RepID=A0ABM7PKR4_9BACT|nr:long-chain fatty acid--CoA ligase [Desulfoluna limicola]BCS97654.1 long-chain-fatty-acid--CoA ligase [Desulfoluna limicola]
MIRRRIPLYQDKIALKDRADGPWVSVTWNEMGATADTLAKALLACGIKAGDRVGIFSQNRAAWTLADLAILTIRGTTVPIYATNSANEAAYIIDDAAISLIFVNDQEQYDKALSLVDRGGCLKTIVAFSPEVRLRPDITSFSYDAFLALGREENRQDELDTCLAEAKSSDLYTIIYTSGTTGTPKGAMHTHESIIAAIHSTRYPMPIKETDISLSFLPLSHVFERSWSWFILSRGAENTYCHDLENVSAFFAEVKPHYMVSPPRLWEKIHGSAMEKLNNSSTIRQKLFQWALQTGRERNRQTNNSHPVGLGLSIKYLLAGLLGLKRIRAIVGGRAKFHHIGGAPLNPDIIDFFVSSGIPMGLGYGLTEVFPICVCSPQDIGFGTSGKPIPLMKMRTGSNGELQAGGPCLMKGYWNNPEATSQAFTEDGWFKTGDVGNVTPEGHICITDRLKEIIITSGGKSIPPQTIESAIKDDIYVEQVVAVGDGRPYVSALVIPSFPILESLAEVMGLSWDDRASLVAHPEIISFYKYRIEQFTQGLGQVKKIKRFTLLSSALTQHAGELTPTMKVKRRVINERYAHIIEAMYS